MNDFNFDDFAPENEPEFEVGLEQISQDAEEANQLQEMMDALEEEIAELKLRYRHLTEKRLPFAMSELGLSKFELKSGAKISIKDSVSGSIQRAPDFQFAKQFLLDHDGGDLLKTEVKTEFGRGSHNEALALAADLREKGYDVAANETVHVSTYAAFGRELLKDYQHKLEKGEAAEMPPFEELGMFYARKAEIKLPKGKK
jgi:hypothetical protein